MRGAVSFIAATIFMCSTALADEPPKRLTAADLAVQTHKWDDKTIQATAKCFYADTNEYRCGVGVSGNTFVRVDFSEIEPDALKKNIEDNCDTVEKMQSRACYVSITFVYESNHREEHNDGGTTMYIVAKDGRATLARVGK